MRVEVCGESSSSSSEKGSALRAVLHVLPEDSEGTFAISLMRLSGDTFEFHALYRKLRERLGDIVRAPPLRPVNALAVSAPAPLLHVD